jgi:hypothetical protein
MRIGRVVSQSSLIRDGDIGELFTMWLDCVNRNHPPELLRQDEFEDIDERTVHWSSRWEHGSVVASRTSKT